MPFTSDIDHNLKIIKNTYSGIITKEDLANVWRYLLSLKEFKELKYNLLSDYRKSNFNISIKEEDGMFLFLMSIKNILNGKKEGAILSNPKDTALSLLLQMKTYESIGFMVKIFSTEEAALFWLGKYHVE
jgi:hypothetical protein